eukprot:gene7697-1747_t
MAQSATGLAAVHGAGMAHLDVKLDNIFAHRDPAPPSDLTFRLGDFGLANAQDEEGDARYLCRAWLQVKEERRRQPADVFSLGACVVELGMLQRRGPSYRLPYNDAGWDALRDGGGDAAALDCGDAAVDDAARQMVQPEWRRRPTAAAVLR